MPFTPSKDDLEDNSFESIVDSIDEDSEEHPEEIEEHGAYQMPLKGGKILSSFVSKELAKSAPGAVVSLERHPEGHEAIDVIVPGFNIKTNSGMGVPVYPIGPGKVIKTTTEGSNKKGGISCTIEHTSDPGLVSYYAHLQELKVGVGTVVSSSSVIGLNGDTGSAKNLAPHVHLSTTFKGKKVNPLTDVIGKEFGSLSKKASTALNIYKTACDFEKLIALHCIKKSHQ